MKKLSVILANESGLHARPASMFVKEASKYKSMIRIEKDGQAYNGKSIMGILSMGTSKGDSLTITTEGADEKEALEALKKLFESNFGE